MNSLPPPASRRGRRWWLRGGLAVLGCVLALVGWSEYHHARRQQALAAVERLGGRLGGQDKTTFPAWTDRARALLGNRLFAPFGRAAGDLDVNLGDTPVSDADLAVVARLDDLTELNLSRTRVTDAGLSHLRGLARLQTLLLDGTPITDAGLPRLRGLRRLQFLSVSHTAVTGAGLDHLRGLRHLDFLWLDGCAITDADLPRLQALGHPRFVASLVDTRVTLVRPGGWRLRPIRAGVFLPEGRFAIPDDPDEDSLVLELRFAYYGPTLDEANFVINDLGVVRRVGSGEFAFGVQGDAYSVGRPGLYSVGTEVRARLRGFQGIYSAGACDLEVLDVPPSSP